MGDGRLVRFSTGISKVSVYIPVTIAEDMCSTTADHAGEKLRYYVRADPDEGDPEEVEVLHLREDLEVRRDRHEGSGPPVRRSQQDQHRQDFEATDPHQEHHEQFRGRRER